MNRTILISKTLITLLLSLIYCIGFAQQTKQITRGEKYRPKEVYYVLKSDTSIKEGTYTVFDYYSKNPIIVGYYKNGLKDSTWTTYNYSNKITSVGSYKEGIRIGEWSYYDNKGELAQQYDFTKKELLYIKNKESYINKEITILEGADTVLKVVDQAPIYIGGQSSMNAYLVRTLIYPREAEKNGVSGRISVYFTIGTDGKASNYTLRQTLGYGMDDEALRVVKGLPDTWIPALLNGKQISSIHKLDIVFKMPD